MNLSHKLSLDELIIKKNSFKKIFFYRICGTGMGACADLFKQKGYNVSGSDIQFYPPMGDYLKNCGISLYENSQVNGEFLKQFDLIIVGNVVSGKSDEARMIEESGVSFCSFPAALGAFILKNENVVGISGTHGKTTTVYLFMQVFEKLGLKPGYLIGGVIENAPSSTLGEGKYFFIESDEYDSAYFEKISKFRLYQIDHLVLTSLEFDHADIFNNIDDIINQFRAIIPTVNGSFIINSDYEAAKIFASEIPKDKKISFYGKESKTGPEILSQNEKGTHFNINYKGEVLTFETNLNGFHNILNLTTVILFALQEGFTKESIQSSILSLKMVKRRQEYKGRYKESMVIDDFAHHPKAVFETISAIKIAYPLKKIHVIMDPSSATARSGIFQKEFGESLLAADSVLIANPAKPTTVKNSGNLDSQLIIGFLKNKKINASVAYELKEILNYLDQWNSSESLFLILSNSTCLGLWESDFPKNLIK